MPEYPKEIEIERVMNVIRGFGWLEVKQEIIEDELHLTIKKKFITEEEKPVTEGPS